MFFVFDFISDRYKTQEMCDRVVSEDPFLIIYWPGEYETQRMCDEAVDDSLAPLKRIFNWFVTTKMIKKLFSALQADENVLYFSEDSGYIVFNCNGTGILNIELNNINIANNLMKMILMLLFLSDIWLGKLNLKNTKRRPKRRWDWCISEDEKKEIHPIFIEEF